MTRMFNVTLLLYIMGKTKENLQRLLDITIEKSEEMGLTLNVKKTECMVISKKSNSSLM